MRSCRLMLVAALMIGSSTGLAADEANTRTFAPQKCRFTLPGPDWRWIENKDPNALCFAGNKDSIVVTLSALPDSSPMNEAFAAGFETGFLKSSGFKKRSGGFVDYRGLRCYQLVSTLPDNRVMYSRVVLGAWTRLCAQSFEFSAPARAPNRPHWSRAAARRGCRFRLRPDAEFLVPDGEDRRLLPDRDPRPVRGRTVPQTRMTVDRRPNSRAGSVSDGHQVPDGLTVSDRTTDVRR